MPSFEVKSDCRYAANHEWIRVEGDQAIVGIGDYAQQQLGDIVYVELPEVGDAFAQDDSFGIVESVKAASDCFLPVAGQVVAINTALEETPELVNSDPFGEGWFVKIRVQDPAQLDTLMDAAAYRAFAEKELQEGGH